MHACVWAYKHAHVCVCNIANRATCNRLLFHCKSLSLKTELKCPRNQNTLICHAHLSHPGGSADSSKATNPQNNLYLAPTDHSSSPLFVITICPARHQRGVLTSPHSLLNLLSALSSLHSYHVVYTSDTKFNTIIKLFTFLSHALWKPSLISR